jgi:hypothetical protein
MEYAIEKYFKKMGQKAYDDTMKSMGYVRANPMRLTGVRGNPAPYPDVAMANELYLFFQNDENLINRRYPEFVKNLERKVKRGIYDREKAVKLFMYLADEVSKKYSKDFGDGKTHFASVPTRMELAKMLLRYYEITRDPSHRVMMNPSPTAARLRRQAEIMEMDERLVPSTLTYEDIKDDPKLIAHYKKIMTPMAWKQLIDDWIRSGVGTYSLGKRRRDFVIPKESEYRRMVGENPSAPAGYHYMPDGRLMADSAHKMNPPALFSKGGYAVVTTYTDGQIDIGTPHSTKAEAEEAALYAQQMASAKSGRTAYKIEVLPVTSVLKNPPLSSHGSNIKTKRTHGLSLAEMRALYKLVKQGNMAAIGYARKKLEVPHSENKVQLLAVIDHHIRDLAG